MDSEKAKEYIEHQNNTEMSISPIVRDVRELRKLIKEATQMKVYQVDHYSYGENGYTSITQEYKEESNPHITIRQGSWNIETGGEYKISIYIPTISIGTRRRLNLEYAKNIFAKIRNALDERFGSDCWNACNEEQSTWKPLSRISVYLQIPNFN